jgi:RNA polymerase sigma-70 factor (ECF subfamily)
MSDDHDLIHRIEQQDQTALALLYERYGAMVYSLIYRILGDKPLSEEATQDTFLKVWRRIARWDADKGRFSSWLLTVARYTAIDHLRSERRQTLPNTLPLDEELSYSGIEELRDGQLLRTLLLQLPDEQRQVIELAFFQSLTHAELAENLKLPLGTVKTRVRLGLQKLRVLWLEAIGQET